VKAKEPPAGEDGPLIALARAGDVRAFEALYRRHVGKVHGLCLRMTRRNDRAEDCTQQTFINAWRAMPTFEGRSAFGSWLHRIAVNVVLSQHPRTFEASPEAEGADVELTFDTPLEVGAIEAAIDALPPGARDVLVLSGIYGYSHAETASMLGIAEGTCKAQLHRARGLLRERLGLEDVG
jgi:RNA polymerase sigma-70 factor (ECF subfamily)